MGIIFIGRKKGLVGMRFNALPFDIMCKGIVTLNTSVARNGLTYLAAAYLNLATDKKELSNIKTNSFRFIYYPDLDRLHYLVPSKNNPDLLIPTKERAIVDYIKLQDEYGDEGILIESIQSYLRDYEEDLPKLYEVADFFKLSREELDYWLNEAKEESDMSMG